jgi:DNA mismatch repair protein MutS2
MDEKTLQTLEYPKILDRLADYAAFSASAQLARALRPKENLEEARYTLGLTSEARLLLSLYSDFSVGGVRDVRPQVELANRAGVLSPSDFLEIKNTLIAAREIAEVFERRGEQFPSLAAIGTRLHPPPGLINAISQVISDDAQVHDHATPKLATIRREIKIAHDRLLSRLERYISDPRTSIYLQEPIITQRGGRYVIPLRAEHKSRVRSLVHDQSASGATLFVEPLAVVELNNRWQELLLAERDEVLRILAELSAQVGKNAALISEMVVALAELDLALMCAKYAEDLHASEPILESFGAQDHSNPANIVRLFQTRHPLLDPQSVVPIDVTLDDQTFALVITGPNTGGKTVTLKTVGLMVLMAQTGLHIPATSGSALVFFNNIFADIGDEQSIEQSLSTFSGHVTNIVRILNFADRHCLVLFDELGAGTDPQEGAALARAILSNLANQHVPCLIATHYPELKAFAHATPGVINASMEFDLHTLRPTYHLITGLPGRSNAFLIAERLGMPAAILDDARSVLNPQDLQADDLLDEIHRQRNRARKARDEAEHKRNESVKLKAELQKRLDHLEDERIKVLNDARSEARLEVEAVLEELREVRRQIKKLLPPQELKELQDAVDEIQEKLDRPTASPIIKTYSKPLFSVGERVRLRTLGMDGIITSVAEEDVEVQAGALRARVRIEDLQRPGKSEETTLDEPKPKAKRPTLVTDGAVSPFYPSPGMELDLRGLRADEALEKLEKHLDQAWLAGLPLVRIIHGKGTGRLRETVRQALRSNAHVKAWETGLDNEGGEGVTIAKMASN